MRGAKTWTLEELVLKLTLVDKDGCNRAFLYLLAPNACLCML